MRLLTIALLCALSFPALSAQPFGTLTIVQSEPPPSGPSPLSAMTDADWRFVELVYAPLYSPKGKDFEPIIAGTTTVSNDGKTLTVSISDNAQWSAGRDITARDVVYTYELARRGKWNRAYAALLSPISTVTVASSGLDIVFELQHSVDTPKKLLTVPLIPSGLHGPLDDESKQRPLPLGVLGAGMYKPANPQDPAVLIHNPRSIRKPKISEVRFVSSGSTDNSIDMVRLNGDTVTFDETPANRCIQDREFGGATIQPEAVEVLAIAIGTAKSLWTDPVIARALRRALPRQALFTKTSGGQASMSAPAPQQPSRGAKRQLRASDPETARKELEGAGWVLPVDLPVRMQRGTAGESRRLELRLLVDADSRINLRRAALLRQRLRLIGVDVVLDPRPRFELVSRIASREFAAALVSLAADMSSLFHTKGMWNSSAFSNVEVDSALDAGQWDKAAALIQAHAPTMVLGATKRSGIAGRNVRAPLVTGRGGFGDFHKWRIR